MDQLVQLTHEKFNLDSEKNGKAHAEILSYKPIGPDEKARRGTLLAILEAQNISEKELDLEKLVNEAFKSLMDEYFSEHAGSPLESLDWAFHQAQKKSQVLVQNLVNLEMGVMAIWGKTLVYFNPQNLFLGIRRENEFFELEQISSGNEELKDQDLIILSTRALADSVLKPELREKQNLSNAEFFEYITQKQSPPESKDPLKGHFINVAITKVPAEEEIIEIHCPPSEHPPKIPLIAPFKKGIQRVLDKLPQLKLFKNTEPTIYLKKNLTQGKKGNLVFLALALAFLSLSILATYHLNRQRQQSTQLNENLTQVHQDLKRAEELSQLNPAESANLIQQAEEIIGSVKGVREDLNSELDTLSQQATDIQKSIYKTTPVNPIPAQLNKNLQQKTYQVSDQKISDFTENTILQNDSSWNQPIRAESYFNNLYVLDPGANAIWKYTSTGPGAIAKNYLQEPVSLAGALDLSIDGSIYILFPDGVEKFTLGKKDGFRLTGEYPAFPNRSLMTTNADADWIFISVEQGILVFDKEGTYQKLLNAEQLTNITELICSEDGKTLYVQKDNEWFGLDYDSTNH